MQRYWWPGYEIQLLAELQRQQNNAQFCDTLLQTEGISVPTHSCILAALSPYLSQKLSASPSPPSGQKRQLKLQAVGAQTLLKLVGLLYSGELEVKGGSEQNDVLSAARRFGITDLVEGQKEGGMKEGEHQNKRVGSCRQKGGGGRERIESREVQDTQDPAEMAGRRATGSPVEKRSLVSTGTQTGKDTAGSSFTHSGQTKPPTREQPESSLAPSLDFSVSLQPQNITLDKNVRFTSFPPIPSIPSGAPSDGQSLATSSDRVTNPTSALASPSNAISHNGDSNSPTPLEDGTCWQPPGGNANDKMADSRRNTERPSHANRDERPGGEKGNPTEKRHAHANVGTKSLAKMKQVQQMMETAQISIKVKLRRRTKGEVWEVVSGHDTDDTLSVLTSMKQDGSNHKRPHAGLTDGEPPPFSVQSGPAHKADTLFLHPATTHSPGPPPHSSTASDSQLLSSDCFTPNQNDRLEPVPLPQPPGPAEESDEQIERLLEDIMMGLNILPNLQRDCKRLHHLQMSDDVAPAIRQVPVAVDDQAQSPTRAAGSAAECVYYQDFETQIGHADTDTAQNQSSCSSRSPVRPDVVLIQQQPSPQYHSSVTSDIPLSKVPNFPYPETPTARSVISTAFYSSGQKLHYPACHGPSSQDDQNILEFLPLTNGNEDQSSPCFSLPCMDDLRLPQCLSPLERFAPAAKHQPVRNDSMDHSDTDQPRPSLHGRPWLTEYPGSLQFPLCAITHRANKNASLPLETTRSCWSKRWQKHLELNSQSVVTWEESCTVKEKETLSAGHQNAAEVKSDPRQMKESLKCNQGGAKGDAAAPKRRKRKRTSHPQDAAGPLLAYKDVKVGDGSQINLSVCSVSLSSNNVLAKKKEKATSSSDILHKFAGKPNEPSTVAASLRERAGGRRDLDTDKTRIRTRAFLKRTHETPSNTRREHSSVVKPIAHRAKIVNKQGFSPPRRRPGRPPKKKPQEIPPESPLAITEKKSHNVESEQEIDNNLPEEEEGEHTKERCKKRRRNRSEVEVIQLKKTLSAESTGNAEADDNDDITPAGRKPGTPKRPGMVSLKEFQKLISRQHSKTRKSKESQDKERNETAGYVESEGKVCGSIYEELNMETEMDITQPQDRDEIEESRVIFSVSVDKNHNHIFNKSTAECGQSQRDDTDSTTSKHTSLVGEEYRPVFSFDVLGEEVTLKNPDDAQIACDAGASETQQTVNKDEGSSHRDTHLGAFCQEDKMPLDHSLGPQTSERTGPPLLATVGFSKSSGCDEEEEEEEEEVDILLYSPDKVPQTGECENGLDNIDTNPEEEEDDDVNEIDVTGDEAE